jgi:acyl-CoA thioesterase I
MSNFLIKSGQKVVFIGDSITDCGRWRDFQPYGNGYVKVAIDLITAKYPERNIAYFNKGIGGNTVADLKGRWEDDVIAIKPDWLTIKIGINDLHSYLDNWQNGQITPAIFEKTYVELLDQAKKKTKAKIILIEPFFISNDKMAGSRRKKVLDLLVTYRAIVDKMAKNYKLPIVKVHDSFMEQIKYRQAGDFSTDCVHPWLGGHTMIALELLKKFGW